ncbi:biopolymer transporter ExbD [Erythrobacter sp. HL-111]|uniref:ExbD/TolR family protein n=1 Tax=Erythrobacter sp. HL-111 TaxID=1798193 RepID=UPI0006DAD637|nr:biopolymer transporter ExbD [Erythrobacter sp. HL-111]KPP96231.1 MAG: biopolymer transport protein ExbD [Erythrobacteraceae bacterium HL-111]SDR77116.1 biopolymer transport protein ExbD [Erythrobacter sp. HL-111]
MIFRRKRPDIALLNVTPLIDVVFILLVFFMLTTNFARFRLIGIDTPQEREVLQDATAAIVIKVNEDGTLAYDGKPASAGDVAREVEALVAVDPGRTFLVRPEDGVTIQEAVDAFQLARDAGAYAVSFATTGEEAGR